MKQIKLVFFVVTAAFISSGAVAQVIPNNFERFMSDLKMAEISAAKHKTYDEFAGSPYLNAEFVNGSITKSDGQTYSNIPMRYNAYDDQIEFKHKDGMVLYIANPEEYKEVEIKGDKYIYLQPTGGKRGVKGYYELLEDGVVQLLKKQAVILKEAEQAKAYKDPVPATFVSKPVTYFLLKDDEIFEISNEKTLFDTFGNSAELQLFIKSNKLKIRKEEDLKKIIAYFNSL